MGPRRQRFGAQEHPGRYRFGDKAGAAPCSPAVPYGDGPLAEGYFVAPTVVELSKPADIWSEELFGPVLAVRRAADADEAFALANDSEFGLSAAVFTQDLTGCCRPWSTSTWVCCT